MHSMQDSPSIGQSNSIVQHVGSTQIHEKGGSDVRLFVLPHLSPGFRLHNVTDMCAETARRRRSTTVRTDLGCSGQNF